MCGWGLSEIALQSTRSKGTVYQQDFSSWFFVLGQLLWEFLFSRGSIPRTAFGTKLIQKVSTNMKLNKEEKETNCALMSLQ